jgi:hypothetical protein
MLTIGRNWMKWLPKQDGLAIPQQLEILWMTVTFYWLRDGGYQMLDARYWMP